MADETIGRAQRLRVRAKTLPRTERKDIIRAIDETELHKCLKEMLARIYPDATVEITHGPNELGKDLVIIREDPVRQHGIGLVVAKGDIRGQTKGVVDRIKSQVEQSLSHPANPSTFFKEVPITEAWVVLAGQISSGARRRLLTELKGDVVVFDIEWLVDSFTEHYPEIFFEGRLSAVFETLIEEIEFGYTLDDVRLPLSECFVEPWIQSIKVRGVDDETKKYYFTFELSRLAILESASKCSILTGGPGSGKTLALAKIALEKLIKASEKATRIGGSGTRTAVPVLLTAREAVSLLEKGALESLQYPDDLRERIYVDTILVDGVDEIEVEQRKELMKRLRHKAQDLGANLVVTIRTLDLVRGGYDGYAVYNLLPFDHTQSMKLLQKLVTDELKIRVIEDGLEKLERRVPLTPLSLRLLVRLVEERNEIPASLAELYQQFTDLALGRYDRKKGIAVIFDYEIKKRFLAELAVHLFVGQNRLAVPMPQFEEFLNKYAGRYNWETDQVPAFVDELRRSCVLEFEPNVAFAHRSFLEFFAGYYIYEHRDEIESLSEKTVERYYRDIWGDVVFFYVGLRRELPEKLLAALLAHVCTEESGEKKLSHAVGKFMIGRLLQAAWHSKSRIKTMGIEGCVESLPDAREQLSRRLENSMGVGWADLVLLLLARESFGSALLAKEAVDVLRGLVSPESESPHRLAKAVALLAGIASHVVPQERLTLVEALQTQISSGEMGTVEKARLMLMLGIPARSLESAEKAIKRRLKRMMRREPRVFEGILPKPQKRWRKP